MQLDWPGENADDPTLPRNRWFHPSSNCCLDFHGDPAASALRVFSDGNHHMALEQTLEAFRAEHALSSIFYCTTPPKVYLDWMESGAIEIGNLRLGVAPDIVIGPDDIMEKLASRDAVRRISVFAQSRGNSLLVRKGNPKNIHDVRDLLSPEIRLFISNPKTESASHAVYRQTLEGFAGDAIGDLLDAGDRVLFGELIHHREAPQAVADGRADAAVVYGHLALRYTRIFPELFERVPLPEGERNITTRYAVGLVDETHGMAGELYRYILGDEAAGIYRHHGLLPIRD